MNIWPKPNIGCAVWFNTHMGLFRYNLYYLEYPLLYEVSREPLKLYFRKFFEPLFYLDDILESGILQKLEIQVFWIKTEK